MLRMSVKELPRRPTIGEVLVRAGLITQQQLAQAEEDAKRNRKAIQQSLVDLGLLSKSGLLKALAESWGVKTVDPPQMELDVEIAGAIPEVVARRHVALPFAREGSTLYVAAADPRDLFVIEDIHLRTGLEVVPYLAMPADIMRALDRIYGRGDVAGILLGDVVKEGTADPEYQMDIGCAEVGSPDDAAIDKESTDSGSPAAAHPLPLGPGGRGAYEAAQEAERDPVDCSVFAPPEARPPDSFLVQVFVHRPEQAEEARSAAKEFDSDSARRGATALGTRVSRGTRLMIELRMPVLHVDRPARELVWRGSSDSVQFEVTPALGRPPATVIGEVLVSQDSVPIGEIKFKLKVAAALAAGDNQAAPSGEARRYRKAFVSYASQDRAEVLRRVQMLTAAGIEFFQDVIDLRPGDRWSDELYDKIDESDVLFLFWSSAARRSDWVEREWRYGLGKKGESFIRPVIIEGPPIPPPPAELAGLHFNDKVLYFLQGTT